MAKKEGNETPLMQQYYATKAKYPDAILLYRMGDFYETFGADAITTSRILGITLTKRSSGSPGTVELAGFPYHAIDTYLPKLVRAGQRVETVLLSTSVKSKSIHRATKFFCREKRSNSTAANMPCSTVWQRRQDGYLPARNFTLPRGTKHFPMVQIQ